MINKANKFIEDGLKARQERRQMLLQIYRDVKHYFVNKRMQKIISKNEKALLTNLSSLAYKNKETEYIASLMEGEHLTGNLLYDWDAKDGDRKNSGGGKFANVLDAQMYHENISNNEMDLIKKHRDEIGELLLHIQPQRVIDMGGGDGKKTRKILGLLPTVALANINFTTKDISPYLGEEYIKNLEEWNVEVGNPIKTGFIYESFLEKRELQSNKDKRFYIFTGGSIGQFDDEAIKTIFQNMISESVLGKRYIIMTAFIAPDKSEKDYEEKIAVLLATYGDPNIKNPFYNQETHTVIEDWVMSGMKYYLGKQIEGKIIFDVRYEDQGEKGGRVLLGAKVIEPFEITIGNKTYKKNMGDFLPAIQSRRFTKNHLIDLIHSAGCEIDAFDQQGGVGQVVIYTPSINLDNITSERISARKRNAKIFGAGLLVVGGMYLGNIRTIQKNKIEKEKNRKTEVNKELGKKNSAYGLGPSAEGIMTNWEYYQEYFEQIYGITNTQEIKFDFLSWYVQSYKQGDITYGGRMGGHTEIIDIIDMYIMQNKLRIKFDKKIDFIPHPELANKEDILKRTLEVDDNFLVPEDSYYYHDDKGENYGAAYYNAYGKKYMKYKMRSDYINMDYIIEKKDGKEYILARRINSNEQFSISNAKLLIKDYFTPIGFNEICGKFGALIDHGETYIRIGDELIKMNIAGYKFDYNLFLYDTYNIKSHYFLQTFFPTIPLKDTLNSNFNIMPAIESIFTEIRNMAPTFGENSLQKNEFISTTFHSLFSTQLTPGFDNRSGGVHKIDTIEMKNRIKANIRDLVVGGIPDFPFQADYLSEDIFSQRGYISKESEAISGSGGGNYGGFNFLPAKGVYTTKEGRTFERGFTEKQGKRLLIARYIGKDNDEFIKKVCVPDIEKRYFSENHYGRGQRERDIINKGRTIENMNMYADIVLKRKQCVGDAYVILNHPNTYFGEMIMNDWINK